MSLAQALLMTFGGAVGATITKAETYSVTMTSTITDVPLDQSFDLSCSVPVVLVSVANAGSGSAGNDVAALNVAASFLDSDTVRLQREGSAVDLFVTVLAVEFSGGRVVHHQAAIGGDAGTSRDVALPESVDPARAALFMSQRGTGQTGRFFWLDGLIDGDTVRFTKSITSATFTQIVELYVLEA